MKLGQRNVVSFALAAVFGHEHKAEATFHQIEQDESAENSIAAFTPFIRCDHENNRNLNSVTSSSTLLVNAMYTYGAPSVAKEPDVSNPGNTCIPGLRMYTEDWEEETVCVPWWSCTTTEKVSNVDFVAHWNVADLPHPKMSTLVLGWKDYTTPVSVVHELAQCSYNNGGLLASQNWPKESESAGSYNHIHDITDNYEGRLLVVPASVRGPALEYVSIAYCNSYTHPDDGKYGLSACHNNYSTQGHKIQGLDMSVWSVAAYASTDEEPVAVYENAQDVDSNGHSIKKCIISFRGTRSGFFGSIDDTYNFLTWNSGTTSYCGHEHVHVGIKNKLWDITHHEKWANAIKPQLETCHELTCVGHSLGGGLCNLLIMCANQSVDFLDQNDDQESWDDYNALAWNKGNDKKRNRFTYGTVDAMYTYGAPSVAKEPDVSNPGNTCIPGLRMYTKDWEEVCIGYWSPWCTTKEKVSNVDFVAHWNVADLPHPKMSTLVLGWKDYTTPVSVVHELAQCSYSNGGLLASQNWPKESESAGSSNHIHDITYNYEGRLLAVPASVRGPALEYVSIAYCNSYTHQDDGKDGLSACHNNYSTQGHKIQGLDMSVWSVAAHALIPPAQAPTYGYGEEPVAVYENTQDVDSNGYNIKKCIISFRGTRSGYFGTIDDTYKFLTWNSGTTSYCGHEHVHVGIRNVLWDITHHEEWASVIKPQLETCHELTCVGHSLGGGLCNLLTMCANQSVDVLDQNDDPESWDDFNALAWFKAELSSESPSMKPSSKPSASPSAKPSSKPSASPSAKPSSKPSASPSAKPSASPSAKPSSKPSASPSAKPSSKPSASPSTRPSVSPSETPSDVPSSTPSNQPSVSVQPSHVPSDQPSVSTQPSSLPSSIPSSSPSETPSSQPSSQPSESPSAKPSVSPSMKPSSKPSSSPSSEPSSKPSQSPSTMPSLTPTFSPSESESPSSSPSKAAKVRITKAPKVNAATLQAQEMKSNGHPTRATALALFMLLGNIYYLLS